MADRVLTPEGIRLACLEIASDNATRAALQDSDKLIAMAERYVAFVTGEKQDQSG